MIILLASGIWKPLFGSSNDCFGQNNPAVQMSEEDAAENAALEAQIIAGWEEETAQCIAGEETPSNSNVTTPELERKIRPNHSPKIKIITNTNFNAAISASKACVLNFK